MVQPSVWKRYRSAEGLERAPPASAPCRQAQPGWLSHTHRVDTLWVKVPSLAEPSPSYRSRGTRCKGCSLAAPPSCHQGGTVSVLLEKPGLQKGENTPYSSSPLSKWMELSPSFLPISWLWQVQCLFVLTVISQNL